MLLVQKPQLAVKLTGEHEGAALRLAVTTDGSQILHRIGVQKFYDFVHNKYLPKFVVSLDVFHVMRFVRLVKYVQYCGMVTSG